MSSLMLATISSLADIYVFAIGSDISDEELLPLAAPESADHYFRLAKIKNLAQTFDDIIGEYRLKE